MNMSHNNKQESEFQQREYNHITESKPVQSVSITFLQVSVFTGMMGTTFSQYLLDNLPCKKNSGMGTVKVVST